MTTDTRSPLWRIIGALGDSPKKTKNGYEAKCPAHEDTHASLSIGTGLDGRVLLSCHRGCTPDAIVAALGLSMGDLFEKSERGNLVRRFHLLNSSGETVAIHVREDMTDDKRIWWETHGKRGLNGTPLADLPLYRLPDVLAADVSRPVIVCEGEKAADALAELGLLAVGTVTGASGTPSNTALEPLRGREVWLWPDNDEPGREHMQRIAQRLGAEPRWIEWKDAPAKGDAADYVANGGNASGVARLLAPRVATPTSTIRIWRGDDLAKAHFESVKWAIPGILPSGLTILGGRPKLGKSWLVLGWCLDIATGGQVLRRVAVERGDTLYLALEDNDRRMQERQVLMLGDVKPPRSFHVVTLDSKFPRQNEGGIEIVEQWLDNTPNARLIVVDTFKRFRPVESKMARLYDLDYDAIAPLHELAGRRNVAIVLVFHTNKTDPSDPIDLISGTLGVSGSADGVLVLKRERGQADASLFVTGRDVEEQDLALKWEKEDTLGWKLLGQADDFRRSKERQEIFDVIRAAPGMTPTEIAQALQKKAGNVRYLLFAMTRDEEVRNRDGKYFALSTNANTPNTPTPSLTPTPVSPNSSNSPNRGVSGVSGLVCRACGNELPPYLAGIGLHYDCREEVG